MCSVRDPKSLQPFTIRLTDELLTLQDRGAPCVDHSLQEGTQIVHILVTYCARIVHALNVRDPWSEIPLQDSLVVLVR